MAGRLMSAEAWRPVPGWEGLYEASDSGLIRSLDRITPRGARSKGRILKPGSNPKGYAIYVLCREAVRSAFTGHSLVASAFLGPRPDGMQIAHGDGVKTNNAVSNLRYATASENAADKKLHGTERNLNKTHCPYDHPYSEGNLVRVKDGAGRRCKTCHREQQAKRRERSKRMAAIVAERTSP